MDDVRGDFQTFLYRPIHKRYKTKKIMPVHPQFQNSVGTLCVLEKG